MVLVFFFVLFFFSGTKLQWSSAITLAVFIWLFTAFWSAMPLIGWGEYDYEPLRTCCTLDYSKGDRWAHPLPVPTMLQEKRIRPLCAAPSCLLRPLCTFPSTGTMYRT